jgi:hypothetical protein
MHCFKPLVEDQVKYCSPACQWAENQKTGKERRRDHPNEPQWRDAVRDGKTIVRVCEQCQQPFEIVPDSKNIRSQVAKRFCSHACHVAAQIAQATIACERCGTVFIRREKKVRFCSRACADAAHRTIPRETRACAHCTKPFTVRADRPQRFCSTACSAQARWARPAFTCEAVS